MGSRNGAEITPGDKYPYFNVNYTVKYWIEKGAPPNKLVLGMPSYGRSFTLAIPSNHGTNAPTYGAGEAGQYTRAAGFLSYYEICENINRGWTVVSDSLSETYAFHGNQWVSYDDANMIHIKANYIRNNGLGGGMMWALDLDDFNGTSCGQGRYPILTELNKVLRGISKNMSYA